MIKIIRVKSWRQAQEIADKMILWGFRGQEDSSWELSTTLHRTAMAFNHPFKHLWHREYWMLRQFQRRAHYYCTDTPDMEQKLDWLALMQHYGAPTRLLDFSHSFYVAAYFALENAIKDAAIWAVNLLALTKRSGQHSGVDTGKENIDRTNQRHIQIVNEYISKDREEKTIKPQLALQVEPERLHERLLIQQGFFLFPCDIGKNFEEVFTAAFKHETSAITKAGKLASDDQDLYKHPLVKIILPQKIRDEAIKNLMKMNISAATLFPGLDGFAKSMKYHISTCPMKNNN
ncbi:MAG: FRG domain-containing protein [Desulfobacteraceae bacterium]|nr:FRG domain-containing protein [Desulfobacteraceae bacterium]